MANKKKQGPITQKGGATLFMLEIGILLIGVLYYSGSLPSAYSDGISEALESIGAGDYTITETTTTYNYYSSDGETEVIEERADLSQLALPYLATTDAQATCSLLGGTFVNSEDQVGCFDTTTEINVSSTCSSATWLAASIQCDAVNAETICEENNIGCFYS